MAPDLIVALDVDELDDALRIRDELQDVANFFKIGKELFTAVGPSCLDALAGARIFLDLKFHDIPNTVAGAVAAAARRGVELVDVHASGGRRMMEAAVEAAGSSDELPRTKVFGVTVLTHLGDDDLKELGWSASSADQVLRLAQLAAASGLDGVVASAWETKAIRQATEDKLEVLVPGVRPQWAAASHDQKRVATPADAARAGARYIVVGRAITAQKNRRDAAKRIVAELSDF